MTQDEIVAAARGCVGARFRPMGRSARFGLDCVGVAATAFGRIGPSGYAMRGGCATDIAARIDGFGLVRVETPAPGTLALIAAGPTQYHLAVLTDAGFVHADARLRKVVETPGVPDEIIALWRES